MKYYPTFILKVPIIDDLRLRKIKSGSIKHKDMDKIIPIESKLYIEPSL